MKTAKFIITAIIHVCIGIVFVLPPFIAIYLTSLWVKLGDWLHLKLCWLFRIEYKKLGDKKKEKGQPAAK